MKIKNLILLFLSCSNVFLNNICTMTVTNNTTINNFNLGEYTPGEYNTLSIKYYLDSAYNTNFEMTKNHASKTSIFNQVLVKYIKEVFNNKYYSNYLSQNGAHFIEFLELSNELNLDTENLITCIRLFYNKIKACEIVDASVLTQILNPMPNLLEKYFSKLDDKINFKYLKQSIQKIILFKLSSYITNIQNNQTIFANELSQEINKITKNEIKNLKTEKEQLYIQERLRSLIIKFLEITLSKLIWDYKNYQPIWGSVCSISNYIERLVEFRIIDHRDDLDDLLWSLVHRFSFFLNLAGSQLPAQFYEEVENDISSGTVFFLELEEQDQAIKTKKEVFLQTLLDAKTKSLAFERLGII
ncbi:MAG: hypothetical protein SZ59_C0002G0160 [candidate division TM6 bacterium GW2011_GWF2_28_16]|nr:MAG: hypothetical protein SZ59_C0002G0160 [candidate division TM6 bacterium GW2011_GWF2_28_16]